MRLAGKIVTVAGLVLLGVLVAACIFVMNFDVNRLRPVLNDKVSDAIGRRFSIQGNMHLDWYRPGQATGWAHVLPSPRLIAEDIQIGNPGWATQPQFITLKAASVDFSLLPLLRKHVKIASVQLVQPMADVERLADGRKNWTFTPASTANGPASAWKIDLGDIVFDKGTMVIRDAVRHIDGVVEISPLGKPVPFAEILQQANSLAMLPAVGGPPDYVFGFSAVGHYNRAEINSSGMVGGVLSLTDASRPFPLQVAAQIGATHIALTGTLTDPVNLAQLDLYLKLSGASMSQLYPLTGVALPDTPPFSSAGHLHAQLSPTGNKFDYERFTGRVGASDLHGSLHYITGAERPLLSGNMASDLLRFADLAPVLGSKPQHDKADVNAIPIARQPVDKIFPVNEFKIERWRRMDADVVYAAKHILLSAALPINELDVHFRLDNGALELQPLHFSTAGGSIAGNILLNSTQLPLKTQISMQVRKLQLAQMFPTIKQMRSSHGEVNGDIRLETTGNSIAAMAAHSNGEMKLLVEQGVVSRNLLELAGLNLANIVVGKLFGDREVTINCAAADMVVQQGQMDPRLFVVDTGDAQIMVDGNIDLAQERVALNVIPHTNGFRILSLRAPLYISGTFIKPKVGVNLKRVALKGGIAVALGLLLAPAAALLPLIAPGHREDAQCGRLILAMQKSSSVIHPGKAAREMSGLNKKK